MSHRNCLIGGNESLCTLALLCFEDGAVEQCFREKIDARGSGKLVDGVFRLFFGQRCVSELSVNGTQDHGCCAGCRVVFGLLRERPRSLGELERFAILEQGDMTSAAFA